MKKTLLSVVAGLAVVSAANAGIKETCLEHPDKLVWVEKNQRCIPINPCVSDDIEIRDTYCDIDFNTIEDNLVQIVKLYARNVLGTEVSSTTHLSSNDGYWYLAVKTMDGGYFVAAGAGFVEYTKDHLVANVIFDARKALGVNGPCVGAEGKFECYTRIDGHVLVEQDCNEIAQLASSLSGVSINSSYKADEKTCVFLYY